MPKHPSTLPDFVELAKSFAGQWIALDPDSHAVLAQGNTATEVYTAAIRQGIKEPLVTRVMESYGYMAPCLR